MAHSQSFDKDSIASTVSSSSPKPSKGPSEEQKYAKFFQNTKLTNMPSEKADAQANNTIETPAPASISAMAQQQQQRDTPNPSHQVRTKTCISIRYGQTS